MQAILFDIDGTLLESDDVDGELYIAAVEHALGKVRIRSSWGEYRHVSDAGILDEILVDNAITRDEHIIAAIKTDFVDRLRRHIEEFGPFAELPGAREFVRTLCSATDRVCGYATGGWSSAALLKLTSAGFPVNGVPLSSADDSPERCAIMQNAIQRLDSCCETVTYYGDGLWDQEAALRLGWNFVPVGAKLGGITSFINCL